MATEVVPLGVIALFALTFAFATLRCSDDRGNPHQSLSFQFPSLDSLSRIAYLKDITEEERRISRKFEADTIPLLSQIGLVTHYTPSGNRTTIFVHGSRWKDRSSFFKAHLLLEASIHDKVVGRAVPVEVRDGLSGELLAFADPPSSLSIYH